MSQRALLISEPDLYHCQPFDEAWLRDLLIEHKLFISNPAGFSERTSLSCDNRAGIADVAAFPSPTHGQSRFLHAGAASAPSVVPSQPQIRVLPSAPIR